MLFIFLTSHNICALSTNQVLANSKEGEKQYETSSAIGGDVIMEDKGYPSVQYPYSTQPLELNKVLEE